MKIMETGAINVLGMMSGTSADGIDGALVRFEPDGRFCLLWHDYDAFPKEVQERLQTLMIKATADDVALMGSYMGELYSLAVDRFRKRHPETIDLLAAHGQTLAHLPDSTVWDGMKIRGTLQALNGSWLAEKSGIGVVYDFRSRDLALGGQGAPLVPFGDVRFFGEVPGDSVLLNIGGIANVTVIRQKRVTAAFDTGPGNMLMDALAMEMTGGASAFDKNGDTAARGKTIHPLLQELLADPYFARQPPKSTGRDRFGRARFSELRKKIGPALSKSGLSPRWGVCPEKAMDGVGVSGLSPRRGVCPPKAMDGLSLGGPPAMDGVVSAKPPDGAVFADPSALGTSPDEDLMSTLLDFTVVTIVQALEQFVFPGGEIARVIVAGGGAENGEFLRRLGKALGRRTCLETSNQYGVPVGAREAMAFAALGEAFARGVPGSVPAATGARKAAILGTWCPGNLDHS